MGYQYGDLKTLMARYNPEKLRDGMNDIGGEQVFFISNPALGLWAWRGNFKEGNRQS